MGNVSGTVFRKAGLRLARSKYYNKTAALLTYTLPQKIKAGAAGAVGAGTSALLGGVSGYRKLSARLRGKNGQPPPPKGKFIRKVERLNIRAWRYHSKNTYRPW